MIDLTPLGSTLSLKAGVVGIALTHAGEVVACGTNIRLDFETSIAWGWRSRGYDLLTVPPEVAEGSTEA